MIKLMRIVALSIFFALFSISSTSAQTPTNTKEIKAKGSISGKVTVDGKPVSGIKVVASLGEHYRDQATAIDYTDGEGNYHLKAVPVGKCQVSVEAAWLARKPKEAKKTAKPDANDKTTADDEDEDDLEDDFVDNPAPVRQLNLAEAEALTDINFDLIQGGVITGRITEANGRPLIGEEVKIEPRNKKGEPMVGLSRFRLNDRSMVYTDDRGIYRVYGLPQGRYAVCVGDRFTEAATLSLGRVSIPQTCYTQTADASQPAIVEIVSGQEVTGIDFKVLRPRRAETFAVSGRVVDALSGKPLSNVSVHCKKEKGYASCLGTSDGKGEFRIDQLTQGKYTIEVWTRDETQWYSQQAAFEVLDHNASGIELKAYRTASISGVVVFENTSSPQVLAKMSQLRVVESERALIGQLDGTKVQTDGSFRIDSLLPEKNVTLTINSSQNDFQVTQLRIERDGVEQTEAFRVQAGEQVTGVRIVVGYYTGKIRGRIKFEGGAQSKDLPSSDSLLSMSAISMEEKRKREALRSTNRAEMVWDIMRRINRSADPDKNGNFVIEWLPPGEYEITVSYYPALRKDLQNESRSPRHRQISQTVYLSDNGEVNVSFTIDLNKPPEDK
jgi:hypothetical protein